MICVSDYCTDCDFFWKTIAACYSGRSWKTWCAFPVPMKNFDSDVFGTVDVNDPDFGRHFDGCGYEQLIHSYFAIRFVPS